MRKIILVLLMVVPVSYAFADGERPKRGCQRKLVNGRFIESTERDGNQGYLETYEPSYTRGGQDDIYVDRYDGAYDARDPGDF